MNLGKLNRQISIEKYSESRTSSGATVKTWSHLVNLFAQIKYLGGAETTEAQQLQGVQSVEFTIRYCSALKANELYRVKYKDEYYNIIFVNEVEIRKVVKLVTEKKTVWQEQ